MKVYQCIHKYAPHIPLFEQKYGIAGWEDITFEALRRLVIEDGYASSYILQPALEGKTDEVFYVLWDYERLQLLWAKENGLLTSDLTKIKLAQIEQYKPDVLYDFSAFIDRDFIERVPASVKVKSCWYGIIKDTPEAFPGYDVRFTLHRPYVRYWNDRGIDAFELQAAIPGNWEQYCTENRDIDILFYGQYFEAFFSQRNELINELIRYADVTGNKVNIHLQYKKEETPLIPVKGFRKFFNRVTYPPKLIRQHAREPVYGDVLYSTIGRAKIVVNAYTDFNSGYKSNLRLFEAIGNGAFLITEEGSYPEGFTPGEDFYTYTDAASLFSQIEKVLSDWPRHSRIAGRTKSKIREYYSKEKQWEQFRNNVAQFL